MKSGASLRSRGAALVVRSEREEASLWRKRNSFDSPGIRVELFDRYRDFARRVARQHVRKRGLADDWRADAEQLAFMGLIAAIERYDPEHGAPFAAYALPRILGSVVDGLGKTDELGARFRYKRRAERERLASVFQGHSEGRSAVETLDDIVTEIALGLLMDREAQVDPNQNNGFETLAWRETYAILSERVAELPEPERTIIRQHYQQDLLFTEIATMLGLSRGRVSQLHQSALHKLKRSMKALV